MPYFFPTCPTAKLEWKAPWVCTLATYLPGIHSKQWHRRWTLEEEEVFFPCLGEGGFHAVPAPFWAKGPQGDEDSEEDEAEVEDEAEESDS